MKLNTCLRAFPNGIIHSHHFFLPFLEPVLMKTAEGELEKPLTLFPAHAHPSPPPRAAELRTEHQFLVKLLGEENPSKPQSQAQRSGNGFNNLKDGNAAQTKQDAMSKLSCNDLL